MLMEPISRQDAIACGHKRYFTGKPCCRGHIAQRLISTFGCLICAALANKAYRLAHPGPILVDQRKRWKRYYWHNHEKEIMRSRKYAAKNKENIRSKASVRQEALMADPVLREKHNARNRVYKKRHPEKRAFVQANRRASKNNATPRWLSEKHRIEIRDLYAQARQLTETTLFEWHVDHIFPLNGKNCSGLHVPWNLQLLPSDLNLRKGART